MEDLWRLVYNDYRPENERHREALLALGNGYIVTRGAAEESHAGPHHYPGTYLSGGYNRLETDINGHIIENEDLVNWPNWLVLKFRLEDGDWVDLDNCKILEYTHELLLAEGVLKRTVVFEDAASRRTELTSSRIVSMKNPHLAVIQWKLNPQNWSGKIIVHAALDGSVTNRGVNRYKALNSKHLSVLDKGGVGDDVIYLKVSTVQSEVVMAQAARLDIKFSLSDSPVERALYTDDEYVCQEAAFLVEENKPVTIEKVVSIYTSRDSAIADPLSEAKKEVTWAGNFDDIHKQHVQAWSEIWRRCDIVIDDGRPLDQVLLRLHLLHLFQTCSWNIIDLDVGVPARGWHGEAYRGHILWDELFIFPFLNFSIPEITRSLLMYRYRRLSEARKAASEAGYKGAMFPWQSSSNGREESQVIHLNPASGRWVPDHTYLQRHVNAAIAYNVWQYYQITGDIEFLSFYGAEMLLDIAKFWASKVHYNEERQKYEIDKVVGPDEYHTAYPGSEEPGLTNNAYTNVMAVWTLVHALETLEKLDVNRVDPLLKSLDITEEEIKRWEKISRNMYVPFLDSFVIEQFEGFDGLEELNWDHYHKQYGDILRLDRILEKEDDSVDRYKAVKQADVLMLFYLFSKEELCALFDRLGYSFDYEKGIANNILYYQKITSHGSTLSKLVYSWVMAKFNREKSWENFSKALVSDFNDIQGGTTAEGIHLGAMAGTVDLVQRCYGGIEFRDEALWFNPLLPDNVKRLTFSLLYRSHWLKVDIEPGHLILKSLGGWGQAVTVIVKGKKYQIKSEQEKKFTFRRKRSPALKRKVAKMNV